MKALALLLLCYCPVNVELPVTRVTLHKVTHQTVPTSAHLHAVMHMYWLEQRTLAFKAVDSYFFATGEACERALPKLLGLARKYAEDGDQIAGSCVVVGNDKEAGTATPQMSEL